MKKRVLMSLVLLAIVGTSAVFAQQPTLDKLKISEGTQGGSDFCIARPANNQISGAVVIPATYNNKPVTSIRDFKNITGITSVSIPNGAIHLGVSAFEGCTGLTSITLPESMTSLDAKAFKDCTNLTSVTILGKFGTATVATPGNFPGDLMSKYKAGGTGTYTRPAGSDTWTKQGGGFSLNGVWTRSDGMKITITDNGQTITITGDKPNGGGKLNDTYAKK